MSLRILLEGCCASSLVSERTGDEDVDELARCRPNAPRLAEAPFVVGRVLLQDFSGAPSLVDLAATRPAVLDGVETCRACDGTSPSIS